MYEIGSSTITMTTKFVMTLSELNEGDTFTISSSYEAETIVEENINPNNLLHSIISNNSENGETSTIVDKKLSIQEINDIINIWDDTDQQDIINRFKYQEDLTDGFGKVGLSLGKCIDSEFDSNGVEVIKSVEYIITVKALENIPANSILRL